MKKDCTASLGCAVLFLTFQPPLQGRWRDGETTEGFKRK